MSNNRFSRRRRRVLCTLGAGLGASLLTGPALANLEELTAAMKAFAAGATVTPGRVQLDIAQLVDNGNAVPLSVSVQSPMTPNDHVTEIALFNEKNPQREIAFFALGPVAGVARVSTRVRLATTQTLVAMARMNDGSVWSASADVFVTLAACIETDSDG
jgi:sulfur-oxidizing protein SoxY